jgi:hypothetical protein
MSKNPDKIGPNRPAIANKRTTSSLRLITPYYMSGPGRNMSQEKPKAMRGVVE